MPTRFCELANAYGIKGFVLKPTGHAKQQLQEAIEFERPVVIDCRVLQIEKVYADGCTRERGQPNGGGGEVKRIVTATVSTKAVC